MRFLLNESTEGEVLSSDGSEFHQVGPMEQNARSPYVTESPLRLETSASSFTKHRVGATSVVLTVYVDIISCWSLLYGGYDGGRE